jgi:L-malate glycosyltransferase
MYLLFLIKRKIENVFIFPFILIGRMYAKSHPLPEYDIFFFFPFYHIGGAEKVHAQIAKAFRKSNAIIFFTKKSKNEFFLNEFKQADLKMVDMSTKTDDKWKYYNNLIQRGIISYYINKQKRKPVVFNGQCNFAYKLSPWLSKHIPQIELIHSLCSFSYIRIPFIQFYFRTVMISKKRIKDHEDLYDRYKIPEKYKKNIRFILNGIDLPTRIKETINESLPLRVLYVGRDTEEKRVDLIAAVAKEVIGEKKVKAEFIFMGDVKNSIPEPLHKYCIFLGNQNETEQIDKIYREADVLLMLSTTEGFPMAIMEAMARGLAIISTSVGEIPLQVANEINGYLINNVDDRDMVFKEAVNYVVKLAENRSLLENFRINNIAHAKQFFGIERFEKEYIELFEQAKKEFSEQ